jgi:hypothetical protein
MNFKIMAALLENHPQNIDGIAKAVFIGYFNYRKGFI